VTRRTYYPVVPVPQQQKKQQQQEPTAYNNNYDNNSNNNYDNNSYICRASATTNDASTGEPKTFSYKKRSDGITTVDVTSPKNETKFSSFFSRTIRQ
jgi:hypothetical protein